MVIRKLEKAMFGAGCFWEIEEAFREVEGIKKTVVGFAGGHTKRPRYREVCSGKTGHAEVVYLEYDPSIIAYEDLLRIFWESHNPTSLNRQGLDVGDQYRSVIFYYNLKQKEIAEKSLKQRQKQYKKPIVTQLIPAKEFNKAEDYHQKYLLKKKLNL